MERTKNNNSESLHALASALVARANMAVRLGVDSYGGARNLYQALGYPTTITSADYYARYERHDIAFALIDRPVRATWQGGLEIIEHSDDKDTPLEKAWIELRDRLKLENVFSRTDRLSGLGSYAVLLCGFDDAPTVEALQLPAAPKALLYLRPFAEKSVIIAQWETNTANARYGKPVMYQLSLNDGVTGTSSTLLVHYTRVLHIVDNPLESEVAGVPRLQMVYNRLMDLEKIVGGDAEMFWRGARPGYQGKMAPDAILTESMKEDLKAQIDEYEHNLRRMLFNKGVTYEAMEQAIHDPASHVEIQLKMLSAATGIPLRILTGSERGELASSQDADTWASYVSTRRTEYAEPVIVRPFVDLMIRYGVLPEPVDKYEVGWSDLYAQSEKEKVGIGKDRAAALQAYFANPVATEAIPIEAFMELFLGLTSDQVTLIQEMRKASLDEASKMEDREPAEEGQEEEEEVQEDTSIEEE